MKKIIPQRIIISRTDSIGDVILTLPMTGIIKKEFPNCKILFLANNYTYDIVKCSAFVDEIINYSEIEKLSEKQQILSLQSFNADTIIHVFPKQKIAKLAAKAKIKNRIATSHRYYHLFNCNYLINFSRKKSNLHESQLNLKLLKPIIGDKSYSLKELNDFTGLKRIAELDDNHKKLLSNDKINLILHPKSKGSGREWGLDNFAELINILPEEKFNIFVSGSENEGKELELNLLNKINKKAHNICGQMSLLQFVTFISYADALVASGTGPLHIAATFGIETIGIFPPIKPIHPQRWQPIGNKTKIFVKEKNCNDCQKSKQCKCINDIRPQEIAQYLNTLKIEKTV